MTEAYTASLEAYDLSLDDTDILKALNMGENRRGEAESLHQYVMQNFRKRIVRVRKTAFLTDFSRETAK